MHNVHFPKINIRKLIFSRWFFVAEVLAVLMLLTLPGLLAGATPPPSVQKAADLSSVFGAPCPPDSYYYNDCSSPAPTTAPPAPPAPTTAAPTVPPTVGGGGGVRNIDPAFSSVWSRTDDPVFKGLATRSWMWGDKPTGRLTALEPYDGKLRQVQYHDKSRMEVTNPNGDRSSLFFVTNGLLVKELISGQVQLGDAIFDSRTPAQVSVAGDPENPNAPTYASFQNIASLNNDRRVPNRTNQNVTASLSRNGTVGELSNPPASVKLIYFDDNLGHNIPDVFWNFMNNKGTVQVNGKYQTDTIINWVYAMGYPIAEAYWTKVLVAGVEKDVLVQPFERRVLTYTPSNSAGFQVEMGNVGVHYYRWRYGGE